MARQRLRLRLYCPCGNMIDFPFLDDRPFACNKCHSVYSVKLTTDTEEIFGVTNPDA